MGLHVQLWTDPQTPDPRVEAACDYCRSDIPIPDESPPDPRLAVFGAWMWIDTPEGRIATIPIGAGVWQPGSGDAKDSIVLVACSPACMREALEAHRARLHAHAIAAGVEPLVLDYGPLRPALKRLGRALTTAAD